MYVYDFIDNTVSFSQPTYFINEEDKNIPVTVVLNEAFSSTNISVLIDVMYDDDDESSNGKYVPV